MHLMKSPLVVVHTFVSHAVFCEHPGRIFNLLPLLWVYISECLSGNIDILERPRNLGDHIAWLEECLHWLTIHHETAGKCGQAQIKVAKLVIEARKLEGSQDSDVHQTGSEAVNLGNILKCVWKKVDDEVFDEQWLAHLLDRTHESMAPGYGVVTISVADVEDDCSKGWDSSGAVSVDAALPETNSLRHEHEIGGIVVESEDVFFEEIVARFMIDCATVGKTLAGVDIPKDCQTHLTDKRPTAMFGL